MTRNVRGNAVVLGMLERGGKVCAGVIDNRTGKTLQPIIRENVEPGVELYTDMHLGYWGLDADYAHQMVDHAVEYVRGHVHTNGIKNFWSLLKRGLTGTYISVEPFHLQAYVTDQVFRNNNRKDMNDGARFVKTLSQIVGKRLTYAELTGKISLSPA